MKTRVKTELCIRERPTKDMADIFVRVWLDGVEINQALAGYVDLEYAREVMNGSREWEVED